MPQRADGPAVVPRVFRESDRGTNFVQIARASEGLHVRLLSGRGGPRAWGADCILVIMASVSDRQAQELSSAAEALGMDVLFEVHDEAELDRALQLDGSLIGINNRDLRSFDVSIESTLRLVPRIPDDRIVVSESGLKTRGDLVRLADHGVRCFLIGESLMRQPNVSAALSELLADDAQVNVKAETADA